MIVPTSPTIHIERRKRRASTYSGPSGHAATISTSEPNTTEMPMIDRTRPSQIGALETSSASRISSLLAAGVADGGAGAAGDGRRRGAAGAGRCGGRFAHGEGEVAAVGGAVVVGQRPGDVALAGREWLQQVDGDGDAVVADLGAADRAERVALADDLRRRARRARRSRTASRSPPAAWSPRHRRRGSTRRCRSALSTDPIGDEQGQPTDRHGDGGTHGAPRARRPNRVFPGGQPRHWRPT